LLSKICQLSGLRCVKDAWYCARVQRALSGKCQQGVFGFNRCVVTTQTLDVLLAGDWQDSEGYVLSVQCARRVMFQFLIQDMIA